jgi:hypothetical protein
MHQYLTEPVLCVPTVPLRAAAILCELVADLTLGPAEVTELALACRAEAEAEAEASAQGERQDGHGHEQPHLVPTPDARLPPSRGSTAIASVSANAATAIATATAPATSLKLDQAHREDDEDDEDTEGGLDIRSFRVLFRALQLQAGTR